MSKDLYISQLKLKLKKLPSEEMVEAMHYVTEYFYEAGEGNEAKVMDELGTPDRLATQILAEYTLKNIENPSQPVSPNKSMRNMLLLVLGIVSLPFSLPVVITLLTMVFVMGFLIVVVGFVFVILMGVGGYLGVTLLGSGITTLFINPPEGLVTTGAALLLLGFALLFTILTYGMFAKLLPYCVSSLAKLFRKAKGELL